MAYDLERRFTFNDDANRYQAYRPRYPEELFEKLIADTRLEPHAQLLEIGVGTGQATESLAKRGYQITGIELGTDLANKTRLVLKDYEKVEIITGAFEDVPLPESRFDLVYSATALHWIRPEFRFIKPYRVLKAEGYLAIIFSEIVSDEQGDKFFFASKPIYEKFTTGNAPDNKEGTFRLPKISNLKPPDIDESLFELRSFTSFPYMATYSGLEYAGLLSTYSPIIALPEEKRRGFLDAIQQLVDTQFDGAAKRHFAMTLAIAKKKTL